MELFFSQDYSQYLFGDYHIQALGDYRVALDCTDLAGIVIVGEEDFGTEADGMKVELEQVDDKLAGKESIVQMLLVFFEMMMIVVDVSWYFDNDYFVDDIEIVDIDIADYFGYQY